VPVPVIVTASMELTFVRLLRFVVSAAFT